jgi:amino acid transporter
VAEEVVFVRRASGLVRELSWLDVALWSIACPAASGMTFYAVKMLGYPDTYGGNIALAFFLAGLIFLPLTIAFYYIVASFPRSSSMYVVVSRTLHSVLGYIPFWYYIVGGGGAMTAGFVMYIGLKAFSGPLAVAGLASGSQSLINMANALIDPVNQLIISIILVIVLWILNLGGMKVVKWTMRVATIIPLVVTVVTLGALAFIGPGQGVAAFESIYGAGSASKIMSVAFNETLSRQYNIPVLTANPLLIGTYGMLFWTLWAWSGLEVTTFIGSEVKDPGKSYLKGLFVGYAVVMALYLFNAFILPYVFNYDFLAAYAYLKANYPDVLSSLLPGKPLPEPSVPFYISIAFPNPAVALLVGLAYFLWYLNTAIPVWVAAVRGFFSMSFDRALPEKMASVSPRFAAPTWANHVTAIIAGLGALITYYEALGATLAKALISWLDFSLFIFVWPVGLSLTLLPWWRPEIFERTVFKSRIATSVLGIIVFAIGWWLMLYTSYPEPSVQMVNIAAGVIGISVYTYMMARNRARGIDPSKIYGQIPPA